MSENQIIEELRKFIIRYKSQARAARRLFISQTEISLMLAGKRPISNRVLKGLGYRKVIMYKAI